MSVDFPVFPLHNLKKIWLNTPSLLPTCIQSMCQYNSSSKMIPVLQLISLSKKDGQIMIIGRSLSSFCSLRSLSSKEPNLVN